MLNIKQITRKLGSTDGAEILEAALVLPLVFMMLLGIVWFGRAFNIYSTIQQPAQQGAITAARNSCATCGNAPSTTVNNTINTVMQASNLDPARIQLPANAPTCAGQPCTPCPSPWPTGGACTPAGNVYICQNVLLNQISSSPVNPNPAPQPPQCGVIVNFQYPFQFYLPYTSLNMQQIVMSAQAQSRMEN